MCDLVFPEFEGQDVVEALQGHILRVSSLLGSAATKNAILAALQARPQLIHLAGHFDHIKLVTFVVERRKWKTRT